MAAAGTQVTGQKAADDAAVEDVRQKFGDQEAARLAGELYKLRRSSGGNLWGVMPRWIVFIAAVWLAVLETASRLPDLLLTYPRYEATKADYQAKILQPILLQAQLEKARNDVTISGYAAQAAANQPRMSAAELEKAQNDAKASKIQPELTAITLAKTVFETQAAVYQPKINEVQLAKLGVETKTAAYQQGLTASQAIQAEQQAAAAQAMLSVLGPAVGQELKAFGINLPMDKLTPALKIIDPAARTSDLQSAMPGSPETSVSHVRRVARKSGS
jgi:hypothetical protein